MTNFLLWIYVLNFFINGNAFSYLANTREMKSVATRRNSKMSKQFPDPRRPIKDFTQFDKFLRGMHKMDGNETDEENDIDEDFGPKIINGRPAEPAEFPWMVALHRYDRFVCSAFLISPKIVMTAAHCVEFENGLEPASSFYGIIDNVNRNGVEKKITFTKLASHPDYGTGGSEGDIALMWISEPVQFSKRIQPLCLPSAGSDFEMNYAQSMGWGITSNDATDAPDNLMTAELNVQNRSMCRIFFAFMLLAITDRHVCAASERSRGVCFGDSGGPLVFEDTFTGRPMAIGIASFVTFLGCGRPFMPSVYTNTAAYTEWIRKTLGEDVAGVCFV